MGLEWIVGALALLGGGWAGSALRPAARARRRASRAVRRVRRERAAQDALVERAERGLGEAAGAYAEHAADARLRAVPIEELKGHGASKVRWGVLRDAGLASAADLAGATRARLVRLKGVGPLSAQRVLGAYRKLLEHNAAEPAPLPRPGEDAPPVAGVVRAARDVLAVDDACAEPRAELAQVHDELRGRLKQVRRDASLLRGVLGGGRAERRARAVAEGGRIVDEVAAHAAEGGILTRSRAARRTAEDALAERSAPADLARDHERRFAEYCARIEAALAAHARERGAPAPPAADGRGGLPEEIAARVEALELRTSALRPTLRGYQAFGAKYALVQERSLLGDEMGLGKTVEALAVMAHLAEAEGARLFLVVAPACVLPSWEREVRKHTTLAAHVLHGADRLEEVARWVEAGGVAVTSFGTLRRLPFFEGGAEGASGAASERARAPAAAGGARSAGARGVPAREHGIRSLREHGEGAGRDASPAPVPAQAPDGPRAPLAGVPLDLLVVDEAHYVKNPEAARTRAVAALVERARRVCFLTGTPLENRLVDFRNLVALLRPEVAEALSATPAPTGELRIGRAAFREAVAPVYLRRNQTDVLRELPARIDKEEWVELGPADARAYREAVRARDAMAMRRAATLGALADGGAAHGGNGAGASHEAGGPEGTGPLSAKLERLAELLDEYRDEGAKVLVFSFFLDVLAALERRFGAVGRITGAVSPRARQRTCDAFAAVDGHAVLLAQIQAGGVGLNLQAASVVVLLEPQWKPSSEEQAIARAHRMGQSRTVLVHRFFAQDSIDERMKELLAEKQELFDAFARTSSVRDASPDAVETGLVRRAVEAEAARLGV